MMNVLLCINLTIVLFFFDKLLSVLIHLCDVMGAEGVDQFVKSLLVFRAVGFGELLYRFIKLFVQFGSDGHAIAVSG